MSIYKQTYNPLTCDFDRVLNKEGVQTIATGFAGTTGIASQYAQAWSRICRIRLQAIAATTSVPESTFVGRIDVMAQNTNPYVTRDSYLQAATLLISVAYPYPEFASKVEFYIKDSVALPADCVKLVEVQRGENMLPPIGLYDLYIRTSKQYDRFFYFYRTNYGTPIFTPFLADPVISDGELTWRIANQYTGLSWVPTDGNSFAFTNATTVTIDHNLNKMPSVTIVDSEGKMILADVQYISTSQITITFSSLTSGTVYLN